MDYRLENLGPERFQEVCHALLAKAFPRTQCFPVGQRDGGRDAVSFYSEHESNDFIVYQVKFVRKPLAEKDPHRWLTEIVKAEAPKLQDLIPKGASQYYLLTNVPGTAHPESGSIDAVQELLASHIEIPGQCWWRDDINRRLDDAWNIKWSYPEILSGTDILRLIVEKGLSEDAERRTSAIRTFVRDQFDRDTEVRFKQVELQNKLLDLFVDVPVNLREPPATRRMGQKESRVIHMIARQERGEHPPDSRESHLGASTLLLHPLAQDNLTRVVVEGAPGQGKSTIVQYICQIHRSRILNEGVSNGRIPNAHRNTPVRLPFKLDCRDFALWLDRKNPFSADEAAEVPTNWQRSLESFLAAQVTHYSGGSSFTVPDLHAVVMLSAVLLVFDGLDEVADIGQRRDVVDEIEKGVNRLREIAVSLQCIVTSRPAAFANSPGLPERTFLYLQLTSISRPLIEQYAEKWLRARRLDGKEASDVRRILKDKLDQPHLRELARNPMQLAILLSLIQTRGGSLPDKRTALYDSYVELFFNREAEKSVVVRDHRDLLIDIHRYLAWVLHSEAQTRENRGNVRAERLRQLVESYLANEGHDPSLARSLFTGMVERVVALVSRVEGTYEFEVQPLREYFAARHLYNTAPYSPPGGERRGTLPERFDALARDFFWQNVTRFYAGCYSKGELPSLVDRLEELARSPDYKHTSHPQSLAATLLADWVFAQHPKSMRKVVALILDGLGLRHITSGGRRYHREEPLVLPKQSGNEQLVERCFELLRTNPPRDYGAMLIELIVANSPAVAAKDRWLKETHLLTGGDRTRWIEYGSYLGALAHLTNPQLEALLDDGVDIDDRLNLILRSGKTQIVEANERRFEAVVSHVLGVNPGMGFRRVHSVVDALAQVLSTSRYACAFQSQLPVPLSSLWERFHPFRDDVDRLSSVDHVAPFPSATKCQEFVNLSLNLSERSAAEWASQIGPWEELVEGGRKLFGDRWAFCVLANTSAGIRAKDEACEDAPELHNKSMALCRRTRYARLRAGVSNWWESELASTTCDLDLAFTLLVFWTWAGPTVLERLAGLADEKLCTLSPDWWLKLSAAIQFTPFGFGQERRKLDLDLEVLPATLSERAVVAISTRIGNQASERLFHKYLSTYDGEDPSVLEFCLSVALLTAQKEPKTWRSWLPIISKSYVRGAISDRYFGYRFMQAVVSELLPIEIAQEIVEHCDSYPIELVGWAERTCRQVVAERITPVGRVAENDRWFS